ncbi:MAG: type IX secretion system ring subunit PorN/GldN [Bacteroidia bacterium]
MKRLIFAPLCLCGSLFAMAQITDPYTYVDEGEPVGEMTEIINWLTEFDPYSSNIETVPEFIKRGVPEQYVWSYPHLREGDVAWMTRYERIIDTRQKMNILLRYPKLSVFDLMLKLALLPDGPKVYGDREFKDELSDIQLRERLQFEVPYDSLDPETGEVYPGTIIDVIPKESFVKIQMMEDWIFDKTQGRMYPRIVAMAIVYSPVIAGGSVTLPEQPLFWIKYEDARPYFANAEVFNKNMAARISMDHFFQARMFDSQIIKEPNVNDYPIKYYPEYEDNGIGALLKSEEIKNELFVMEHDLWEY